MTLEQPDWVIALEHAPERLAAIELVGVEWSDWGRPERIETVLALRRTRRLLSTRAKDTQ